MSHSHNVVVALALVGGAFATTPAAAECSLKIVASVDAEIDEQDGAMLVPADFGASRKLLLLDTGGSLHMLRGEVVKELELSTKIHPAVVFIDMLGRETRTIATIPTLSLGRLTAHAVEFAVMTDGALIGADNRIAGVLSTTMLRNYDVDLDFPARKFSLVSPDHCPGQVVYWANSGVAVVPMHLSADGHILLDVTVDGHVLNALLDTGSSHTTMYLPVAELMGVAPGRPDVTEAGQMGGQLAIYSHRFRTLAIEGITVNNPNVMLIPDRTGHRTTRGSSILSMLPTRAERERPKMFLGMSILRHLHLYIAYNESKLYITAGVAPAPAATAQPAGEPH